MLKEGKRNGTANHVLQSSSPLQTHSSCSAVNGSSPTPLSHAKSRHLKGHVIKNIKRGKRWISVTLEHSGRLITSVFSCSLKAPCCLSPYRHPGSLECPKETSAQQASTVARAVGTQGVCTCSVVQRQGPEVGWGWKWLYHHCERKVPMDRDKDRET